MKFHIPGTETLIKVVSWSNYYVHVYDCANDTVGI